MAVQVLDRMTSREYEIFNQRKEMFELEAQHAIQMKELEIEVQKIEAKWSSLLRLPVLIITLPVRIVLAVAFCIAVARKHELSEPFWNYMK